MKSSKSLNELIPYLKKYKLRIISGILFVILTNAFSSLVPKILGFAIDTLTADFDRQTLLKYTFYIIGLALSAGFFRFLMRYTLIGMSRKIEFDLRGDYLRHLQFQPQAFFDKNRTGDLMSRATNDLNAVRNVLGPGIMYSVNTVVLFSYVLVYMIQINLKLTLISLLPFPLLAFLIKRFGTGVYFWFEKIQAQMSSISARAQENLSGIRIIKAYRREKSEISSFRKLSQDYVSLNRRLIRIWSFFFPTIQFVSGFGFVFVLWFGGKSVINGTISIGGFTAFNTYLVMLLWPVIATGWVVNIFQRGAASMDRINKIMSIESEINDDNSDASITSIEGEIEIRNLNFAFDSENGINILKNINLKIPKGSAAAIIGHTGSGKSALVSLIPRVYDPPPGTVFIDGRDIRTIPLNVLRNSIGFVPQETFLFSDTIKENIVYGIDSYSDPQLYESVEISQLKENIEEFPQRYETFLGERGINLSGGQKQRTAISRAVIREPKILILDDALSSVDTKTEEEILLRLKDVMKSRTSLIISHRVSTIKDADMIYVLENGEIAEQGTHSELLERDGIYAGIYRKQQLAEELDSV